MRKIIILGTARKDGDTQKIADIVKSKSGADLIDLNDYDISYYDYEHNNRHDDFLPLIRSIIDNYDTLIFATPVYWYSMSGIMKVFFDRISDLLTIEKDLGRRLRGKNMAVVSCSYGGNLGEAFWLPFSESAQYLGMQYLGNVHTVIQEEITAEHDFLIGDFVSRINAEAEKIKAGN